MVSPEPCAPSSFRPPPALVLISQAGEMPCSCPGQIREMDKGGGRGEAGIWVAWLTLQRALVLLSPVA